MTYRLIPQRWLRWVQLATLTATGIVGASIWVTPADRDSKLTVIEQAMNVKVWAVALVLFSAVGLVCELWMNRHDDERLIGVVAWCHTLLCGLLVGYSVAALVGVLVRVPWNFGAPTIGLLMAFWHLMFVKRRPRA